MSQLKGKEFIDPKFFDELVEGARQADKVIQGLKKTLQSDIKAGGKGIQLIKPESVENINKFNKAVSNTRTQIGQLTKLEAKELQLQKDISKLKTDEIYKKQNKSIEKLRQEKNALNKTTRESISLEKQEANSIAKLRLENKKLLKERNQLNLATKTGVKRAKELNGQIERNTQLVLKNASPTEKRISNIGKYSTAFRGLASSIGLTLGVAGAFRLLKSSIGIVRDFELQSATLAGVLNKTREEIQELDADSKRLGESTVFAATAVSGLQESYARLGFSIPEILNVTGATLDLAAALGSDLSETAELVGKTLNAFGLDSSETLNVVNSLTRVTQNSALTFEGLKESLSFVAPTAKALGLDLQQTSGILGVLVDNGIAASRSGRLLSSSFARLNKQGLTLNDAIEEINSSTDKTATATELFGVQSFTLGLILAENVDKVSELTDKIRDNENATRDLAEAQKNTLDGSLKLLNSAWESYILNLNDATNGGNLLTKGIRFLSENLDTILNTVGKAILVFTTYKVTVFAVNTAMKAYNAISGLFQNGIKGVTSAFKKLNKVTKANLIGLFVAAIVLAVTVLKDFIGALSTSEKAQKRLNNAQLEAKKTISGEVSEIEVLIEISKDETKSKDERLAAIKRLNDISPEYLGNLTLENINTKESDNATKAYISSLLKLAETKALQNELDKLSTEILDEKNKSASEELSLWDKTVVALRTVNPLKSQTNRLFDASTDAVKRAIANQKDNLISLEAQREAILAKIVALSDVNTITDKNTEVTTTNTKETEKGNKEKKKEISITKELNEIQAKADKEKSDRDKITSDRESKRQKELDDIQKKADKEAKDKADKKAKEESDRIKKQKETYEALNNIADAFAKRQRDRSDKRVDGFNDEIESSKKRADAFRQIALAGSLSAQQSLAVEQKREADATLSKEKEIQKQKRIESSLALLKTYTGALENGSTPSQALAEVLKNGTLLAGLINALPSFFEGTESTTGGNIDDRGGFLSVLHPDERVVPKKYNDSLEGIPNSALPELGNIYRGMLITPPTVQVTQQSKWSSNKEILSKFDSLENTIKGINIPAVSYDFDNLSGVVTQIVKSNNATNRIHKKNSSLWD